MDHVKLIIGSMLFSLIGIGLQSTESLQSIKKESKKSIVMNIAPMKISIIVSSVRSTTTGQQIAKIIQTLLKNRTDITTEIMYVGHYHLPFYTDEVSPASRTGEIVDPVLKKWSEAVSQAEGFIIVSPEYNGGYCASLKNALDSLYKEWNNKPAAIVGYSGGPSGGACMIAQLQQVFARLEMISVTTSIKIPSSWKAFDEQGNLVGVSTIEKELHIMVDELLKARNK